MGRTMYSVIENNKPAILENTDWNAYQYISQEEADKYLRAWLGHYAECIPYPLILNKEYDYSGYGDRVKIIEEEIDD